MKTKRWVKPLGILAVGVLIGTLGTRTGLQVPEPLGTALAGEGRRAQAPQQAGWDLTPEEQVNVAVYEKANRSVVNINTTVRTEEFFFLTEQEHEGTGSGCVWDRAGHIITNYHVIRDAARSGNISVQLYDGSPYPAQVVGRDPLNDLAVLRVAAPRHKLFPVEPGDSASLRVGLRVFVIGNPFGLERTMTTGIISSLNRRLRPSSRDVRQIRNVIQTDAAINPGNSGGPLLDKHGRLIGLNTAIVSPVGQSSGVGFAIPVNNIKRVVPQLIQYGRVRRADLGILTVFESDQGLFIVRLARGGAAAEAGLRGPRVVRERRGRYVHEYADPTLADRIVAIDDQPVKSFEELLAYVESKKPGDTVKVTFVRDGERYQANVRLKLEG